MKLYQIEQDQAILGEWLEESGGELTPAIEELLALTEENLEGKCENICKLIRNLEAERDACKAEAQRLSEQARLRDNKIGQVKDYLLYHLRRMGKNKVDAGLFKVGFQKSPPTLVIANEEVVPAQYRKASVTLPVLEMPPELLPEATITVDKSLLKSAVQAGLELPGVTIEQGDHLRIR
jgi:hypothetical protein